MNNVSIHKSILLRLTLSAVFAVCFVLALLGLIFSSSIQSDLNTLKISHRNIMSLAVNRLDTTLHDMRLAIKSDEVRIRMKDVLYYTNYVDAVYVLDENLSIKRSYFKDTSLTDNIAFYALKEDGFYINKFVYNEAPDKSFLLMALRESGVVVVSMINLDKFASSVLGDNTNSFLLDKDGYMYSPLNLGKKAIFEEISLDKDWQEGISGSANNMVENKLEYYISDYVKHIKLGIYSKKYYSDIISNFNLFFLLCACAFVLLVAMFWHTVNYINKNFILPLRKFRQFLVDISKNEYPSYNFGGNSEFKFLYEKAIGIYFDLKNANNKANVYQVEHELLFNSSNLIILCINAKNGRILACSQRAAEFYEYKKEDFLKKTIFDLEETSLVDFYRSRYGVMNNGMPVTNVHKTANGNKKFVSLNMGCAIHDGNASYVVVVHDYTKNISMAKTLNSLNNISQVGPTVTLGLDASMRIKLASDNVENVLKRNKSDILGKKLDELESLFESKEQIREIKDFFYSGSAGSKLMRIRMKTENGETLHLKASLLINRDEGTPILYVFLNDISSLHFELSHKDAQIKRYESQLEGSLFITWEYDIKRKTYSFSSQFFALMDKNYIKEIRHNSLSEYISSEYIPLLYDEIDRAANDKTYSFVLNLQGANRANLVWLSMKGKKAVIKTAGVEKEVVLGTIENITERMKSNARVNLLAQIFTQSKEAIIISDENDEMIEVNEAFTEITGYTLEDVKGKRPKMLTSGEYGDEFFVDLIDGVSKVGFWSGEMNDKRKNGEIFPIKLSVSALKDETGKVCNFIAILTDITELKNKEKELEQIAFYDGLTGLANKRKLMQIVDDAIEECSLKNENFSLLYMDLDGFKAANDTYGHSCGDDVLKEVSRRLLNVLEKNNLSHSVVSRLGGDEFVCVLMDDYESCSIDKKNAIDNASDACVLEGHAGNGAIDVANEIINDINEKFIIGDYNVKIGVTIGITHFDAKNATSSHELLEEGDWAMYQAKLAGKNCYYEFNESTSKIYKEYKNLLAKLEKFDTNNFVLLYQPIYDTINNNILALEANLQLKDSASVLTTGDLSNILSQKYWFSDLNIWILESALNAMRKLALLNVTLYVNTPISQLNSNAYFKKFTAFAKDKDLSNIKILLNDIHTARNPADEVNELKKKYKEFGIDFVIDEIDERSSELISSVNVKDVRISKSYTKDIIENHENIYKIKYILDFCTNEGKRVSTKYANNPYSYKILSTLGIECLGGKFIGEARQSDELKDAINTFHDRKERLRQMSMLGGLDKNTAISMYEFIVFENGYLEKMIKMLKVDNLRLFDINAYKEGFAKLRESQDDSLAWVCDDTHLLMMNIYNGSGDRNENIARLINEQLRLLKHIIGE